MFVVAGNTIVKLIIEIQINSKGSRLIIRIDTVNIASGGFIRKTTTQQQPTNQTDNK